MMKLEFDEETIDAVASKIADQAYMKLEKRLDTYSKWPAVLDTKGLKEFLGCGINKAEELMNRSDFYPVVHGLGRRKAVTSLVMKWLVEHSDWSKENSQWDQVI